MKFAIKTKEESLLLVIETKWVRPQDLRTLYKHTARLFFPLEIAFRLTDVEYAQTCPPINASGVSSSPSLTPQLGRSHISLPHPLHIQAHTEVVEAGMNSWKLGVWQLHLSAQRGRLFKAGGQVCMWVY